MKRWGASFVLGLCLWGQNTRAAIVLTPVDITLFSIGPDDSVFEVADLNGDGMGDPLNPDFVATAVYLPRIYVPSLPGFALVTALAIDVLYQNRPRLTWALAVVAIAGNLGLAVFNDSLAVSPPFLSGGFFQPWRDLGIMLP